MGDGSEVLGFDDAVSLDHDFGPRVQIFVATEAEFDRAERTLTRLPRSFEGFPVATQITARTLGGASPAVDVTTASRFFHDRIGCDPAEGMRLEDWLTAPTQRLATLIGGEVFADPDGSLMARRQVLQWYPLDVWRYVLAAAWLRVSQEEAFIARAGAAGDDLGSALVTARVARDLVRIAFLVERRWAPYSKWLGSAFACLTVADVVEPHLSEAVRASDWRAREEAICSAQRELAKATNRLGLAEEVDPEPRQFFDRDIRVLRGDRFTEALTAQISDPEVRALLDRHGRRSRDGTSTIPGAIDQVVDSVDVLTAPGRCRSAGAVLGLER